jgi:hypothetical protein
VTAAQGIRCALIRSAAYIAQTAVISQSTSATCLKKLLISAHCTGWLPAWAVSMAFSIFNLKAK